MRFAVHEDFSKLLFIIVYSKQNSDGRENESELMFVFFQMIGLLKEKQNKIEEKTLFILFLISVKQAEKYHVFLEGSDAN